MAINGISGAQSGSPDAHVLPKMPRDGLESNEGKAASPPTGEIRDHVDLSSSEGNAAMASQEHSPAEPAAGQNQRLGTRLHVDEATERVVAQILDQNREVVRQIPPEEQLRIIARAREITGMLFDSHV